MTDWTQLRQDVLAGMSTLTTQLSRAAQRTGRELALVEARAELLRVERELARRYQGLGEAAYEEWRRVGALAMQGAVMREYMQTIGELTAQRDRLKRELSDQEPPWSTGGGAER